MFRLTAAEWKRSQSVTGSQKHRDPRSIHLVVAAQRQQEKRILAFVLYEAKDDPKVVLHRCRPLPRQRPFELVTSQEWVEGILGETVEREGESGRELGVLLDRPSSGADEGRRAYELPLQERISRISSSGVLASQPPAATSLFGLVGALLAPCHVPNRSGIVTGMPMEARTGRA